LASWSAGATNGHDLADWIAATHELEATEAQQSYIPSDVEAADST
jgi:hypothetical protein